MEALVANKAVTHREMREFAMAYIIKNRVNEIDELLFFARSRAEPLPIILVNESGTIPTEAAMEHFGLSRYLPSNGLDLIPDLRSPRDKLQRTLEEIRAGERTPRPRWASAAQ